MKKIIYILIGLLMVGNMIYGEEKFPPYPDVWGVELNWKDKSSLESRRMTAGGIYKMKDGDIGIPIFSENNDAIYTISFFTGKKLKKEDREYSTKKSDYLEGKIEYGDENTRAFLSGYYIIKKNSIKEKIKILYLLDKTINTADGTFEYYCEYNDSLKTKKNRINVINIKSGDFIKCEDNSIIFCESDGNIILRFDENFNCNSDLIGKKIFIIKQSEYEKIENKLREKDILNDQTMNDEIYKYLISIRRK